MTYYPEDLKHDWTLEQKKLKQFLGQKITEAGHGPNGLRLVIDGSMIDIYDSQQSCCEKRYMTVEPGEVESIVGAEFLGVEVRGLGEGEGGDVHEIAFLVVHTNQGDLVIANHNEHNGYYGGFTLTVKVS